MNARDEFRQEVIRHQVYIIYIDMQKQPAPMPYVGRNHTDCQTDLASSQRTAHLDIRANGLLIIVSCSWHRRNSPLIFFISALDLILWTY